jgi:hypothetical protein
MNKGKVGSKHLWKIKCFLNETPRHNYLFIDESGERIYAHSKEEYRERYGNRFDSYINL